jgi:hypothetical protein
MVLSDILANGTHTHPQDQSSPSSIDPHEWQLLAQARCDRRPLLALIVGRMICILNTCMQLGGDKRSCGVLSHSATR